MYLNTQQAGGVQLRAFDTPPVLALGGAATLGADPGAKIDFSAVLAALHLISAIEGQTALSGGGAAGATPIQANITRFTTTAGDHDSGILPPGLAGMFMVVINAGGHILDVYPDQTTPDQINAIAAGSPFSMAATKVALFFCPVAGHWHSLLTA